MSDALIGHTGFVGTTLLRQRPFDALYRSTTVASIAGQAFDLVVCAGVSAQKWIANREPERDRQGIESLIACLRQVRAKRFVLISTVDVFLAPDGPDEATPVDESGLHPYGLHRRMLESFVERQFPQCLIVRLPGLVGPGLRKNVIFDFLHGNNLQAVDSRAIYQFYPMVNLWHDIDTALRMELDLLHLSAEPVSVSEVARDGFGIAFDQCLAGSPARYDLKSRHAARFGGNGPYHYSKRETLQAIRAYAQSEPQQGEARPQGTQ